MHAANALGAPEGQPVGRAVASAGEAGWVDERGSSSGRAGRTRTSRNGIGTPGTFCGYRRSGPRLFSHRLPAATSPPTIANGIALIRRRGRSWILPQAPAGDKTKVSERAARRFEDCSGTVSGKQAVGRNAFARMLESGRRDPVRADSPSKNRGIRRNCSFC